MILPDTSLRALAAVQLWPCRALAASLARHPAAALRVRAASASTAAAAAAAETIRAHLLAGNQRQAPPSAHPQGYLGRTLLTFSYRLLPPHRHSRLA
ncbi:hypothetical protein V8C26DRAFT_404643 [Trichoderma gracile]